MYNNKQQPLPLEKAISALSYITIGFVGFIWLILGALLKQNLRPFIKYHIYQSIFISILFFIISGALSLVLGILSYIPIINSIVATITFLLATPLFVFSILQYIMLAILAYIITTTLQGKFTYIPWVSDIIRDNV